MLKKEKVVFSKKIINLIIFSIGLFLTVFVTAIFIINPIMTRQKQMAVHTGIASSMDRIIILGDVLTDSLEDKGCDKSSSVGLQLHMVCSFRGDKYFNIDDNLEKNLQSLDKQLLEAGFKRSLLNYDAANKDFTEALVKVDSGYSLDYVLIKDPQITARIGFNNAAEDQMNIVFKDALDGGFLSSSDHTKLGLGVTIVGIYHSCESELFCKVVW